jgi:stage V sporulation protein B
MKFFKTVIATFATNILVLCLGLVMTTVTAKWLGSQAKGVLGVSGSVVALFLILSDLGIGVANTYFIAKYRDKINSILGCNVLIILLECILVAVLYIVSRQYRSFFVFKFLFNGLTGQVLFITLVTVPISSLKSCLANILLGLQNYGRYNKLNIMAQAVNAILLVLFLLIARSVFLAVLANMITMIVIIICIVLLLYRAGYRVTFSWFLFSGMVRYGFKGQLSNLVQFVTYNLDIFIINNSIGQAAAGCYYQAVVIANLMWQIPQTIASIMYPMVSNSDDKNYIHKITNKTVRISIPCVLLLSLLLGLLNRPIILAVGSNQFESSISALVFMIPGIAVFSISKILASSIAGMGRTDINLIIAASVSVLTIILDFTFIPIYGINGASVLTSITYSIHALLTVLFYRKLTGSSFSEILILQKADLRDIRKLIQDKLKIKKIQG